MKKISFKYFNKDGYQTTTNEQLVPDTDEPEIVVSLLLKFAKSGEVPYENYFQNGLDLINYLVSRKIINIDKSVDRTFRNKILLQLLTEALNRLNHFDGGHRLLELVVEEVLHPDCAELKWAD